MQECKVGEKGGFGCTSKKEEDLNIAGWTLTNESEGKVYSYKFPKNTKLKQGETCTIWSADSDEVRSMIFKYLLFISHNVT